MNMPLDLIGPPCRNARFRLDAGSGLTCDRLALAAADRWRRLCSASSALPAETAEPAADHRARPTRRRACACGTPMRG